MALVLPLIFVFLLALVDFGIAIDRREVLQHAVYEGSRRGIVGTTIDEIKDRTIDQSQGLLEEDDIAVCYIDNDGNGDIGAGDDVRVSADYDYVFTAGSGEMFGFFGADPPSIALTPHADSRLANGPQGSEPTC
jgi:TadE-like protein